MKILIIGGYGVFGGRLVDLLLDDPRLEILVAGRNLAAARSFCESRSATAGLAPLAIERADCAAQIMEHKPDLVVDASGPFQIYGDEPYAVAQAALAAGADYVDLADGADFVSGIAVLNQQAIAAGRFALSGMSTFPVLAAAAARQLVKDMDSVHNMVAGIAPSPFAAVGMNVIKAIAGYAGKPVRVLIGGAWQERAGFFDSRRMTVNVPGEIPLRPRRFALVDVPDLQLLPKDWPEMKTMWSGAGPTPALLHRLLWLAAGLVKMRLLPSLHPLVPVMNRVVNTARWGEHRGGMIVEVTGSAGGREARRSWHLLAEGDGGPLIPSMAAAAIVRLCLNSLRPKSGARPGHRDLELAQYQPFFAAYGIRSGIRRNDAGLTLYQDVMGDAFQRLEAPVRAFHGKAASYRGKANVDCGRSWIAKLDVAVTRDQ